MIFIRSLGDAYAYIDQHSGRFDEQTKKKAAAVGQIPGQELSGDQSIGMNGDKTAEPDSDSELSTAPSDLETRKYDMIGPPVGEETSPPIDRDSDPEIIKKYDRNQRQHAKEWLHCD